MTGKFKKLVDMVSSRESTTSLVQRIIDNPRTTRWAWLLASGFGAAYGLREAKFELASWLVGGATALLAVGIQLFSRDPDPPGAA